MALNLGMSHAVVQVRDLDVMLDFYTQVLQFEVTDRGPLDLGDRGELDPIKAEIVFMSQDPNEHHQLAFVPTRAGDTRGPVDHLAFRTDDLTAIQELVGALTEYGIKVRPVSHGNTWSCYFRDPEGNGIEIFTKTPFHVSQPQAVPVDLSLSEEELLAWTTERFGDEPEFGPIDEYETRRAEELSGRS